MNELIPKYEQGNQKQQQTASTRCFVLLQSDQTNQSIAGDACLVRISAGTDGGGSGGGSSCNFRRQNG